jgi:hypothetical protein
MTPVELEPAAGRKSFSEPGQEAIRSGSFGLPVRVAVDAALVDPVVGLRGNPAWSPPPDHARR